MNSTKLTPLDVCRKLARLKSGPTKAKTAEWIGKILELAEEARAACEGPNAIAKAESGAAS